MDLPWNELPIRSFDCTKDQFKAGRRRLFGRTNPELVHDPFQEEMIRKGCSAWHAKEFFGHDSSSKREPTWCFDRSGMSETVYQGEYIIYIGGEHEDWYDPDFMIYNDLIVRSLDGDIWIYRYPRYEFQPTDFHTATLIEEEDGILILGCLGYKEDREYWRTPAYWLDLNDLTILPFETKGREPGWIHGHTAELRGSEILIRGGKVLQDNGKFVENSREWRLDFQAREWVA